MVRLKKPTHQPIFGRVSGNNKFIF